MTDQEASAKNWKMVEKRNALRATVTRLENELREFQNSWRELCNAEDYRNPPHYKFHPDEIEILRFSVRDTRDPKYPQYQSERSLLIKHFDVKAIEALLTDLTNSRAELEILRRELATLGVSD